MADASVKAKAAALRSLGARCEQMMKDKFEAHERESARYKPTFDLEDPVEALKMLSPREDSTTEADWAGESGWFVTPASKSKRSDLQSAIDDASSNDDDDTGSGAG